MKNRKRTTTTCQTRRGCRARVLTGSADDGSGALVVHGHAAARAWERGVDELAAEDSEVAEYVASLEQMQDATELPEASGDAIAAEFERYLRRRQG